MRTKITRPDWPGDEVVLTENFSNPLELALHVTEAQGGGHQRWSTTVFLTLDGAMALRDHLMQWVSLQPREGDDELLADLSPCVIAMGDN